MVRLFDGVDDYVKLAASSAIDAITAPITIAAIIRRTGTGASFGGNVCALATSADVNQPMQLRFTTADVLRWVGASNSDGPTLASLAWMFVCVRKATGTVAPRFSHMIYNAAATVTHTAGASTSGNGSAMGAGGFVWLGAGAGGATQLCALKIHSLAIWDVRLEDVSVEWLPWFPGLHWFAPPGNATVPGVAPKAMWMLDQAATGQKVRDITGNGSDENTLVGTSALSLPAPAISYGAEPIYVTRGVPAAAAAGRGSLSLLGAGPA